MQNQSSDRCARSSNTCQATSSAQRYTELTRGRENGGGGGKIAKKDVKLYIQVAKELNRPFMMVMDFVEDAVDLSLPYEKIKVPLPPSLSLPSFVTTSLSSLNMILQEYLIWNGDEGSQAQKRLQAIGELLCVDVLLNNWDR